MRKIVFLGHMQGYGGAERSMINVANAMSNVGFEVKIISFGHSVITYPVNDSIEVICIDNNLSGLKKYRYWIKELGKHLTEINPDVVVSFWLIVNILSIIHKKKLGYKTIYSERGDPGDSEYSGVLGVLRKHYLKKNDGFVFQTNGALSYFNKKIQAKSIVIPNPVYISDSSYSLPLVRDKEIVNVGRLHPQKNQKLLIKAFSLVHEKYPEHVLKIYGDGELKDELASYIKCLGLENKVYLMGTTKDIYQTIKNANLFVLSSVYEGMPNALMEAMALGIPSISTDCPPGGPKEIIKDMENGLLCYHFDEVELSSKIDRVLSDEEFSRKLSKNAKQICNTHSQEKIFNKWKDYLIEV